jgi:hypothetical protein
MLNFTNQLNIYINEVQIFFNSVFLQNFTKPTLEGEAFFEVIIILSLSIVILGIGSFIFNSSNAAKQGLKKVGQILTGLAAGGSLYTGGKEVYKDGKAYLDKSGETIKNDSSKSTNKSGSSSTENSGSNSKG